MLAHEFEPDSKRLTKCKWDAFYLTRALRDHNHLWRVIAELEGTTEPRNAQPDCRGDAGYEY